MTEEKKQTIIKVQEAIGRSPDRLKVLKSIGRRETVLELRKKLNISQPNMSKAISRLESYGLIHQLRKDRGSEIYEKVPMLKQIGNLDSVINMELEEDSDEKIAKKHFKVKPIILSDVPFLTAQIEADARKMFQPYVTLYLLENSIRNLIIEFYSKKYGKDWWTKITIDSDIKNDVNNRIAEEKKNKWHVIRGAHEIFYTDLIDLCYFLNKERTEFETIFKVDFWITIIKEVVKLSRNIVDHHNPLPKREIDRLEEILEDWKRQLKGVTIQPEAQSSPKPRTTS